MLPSNDHTPVTFQVPKASNIELVKRLIRRVVYPIYNFINHQFLKRRYISANFQPDLWFWGQRGNDYERHRARVSSFISVQDARLLVAGCGTARDIQSWIKLKPKYIVGIDWFSYRRAWDLLISHYRKITAVKVEFIQADLTNLSSIPDDSFDIVSSDAVFEHLKNMPEVLAEFHRVLRPGGVLYATFGPLWFGYGGDHVSGYDKLTSGYNHLLLKDGAYKEYLDAMGEHQHSEDDGRTWIEHDLFSKLRPQEYLDCLEASGFKRLFVSVIIDPLAIACLKNPKLNKTLLEQYSLLDVVISGMTIIYQRKI